MVCALRTSDGRILGLGRKARNEKILVNKAVTRDISTVKLRASLKHGISTSNYCVSKVIYDDQF